MKRALWHHAVFSTLFPALLAAALFSSCKSEPVFKETPIAVQAPDQTGGDRGASLSGEIRILVENGSPSSLQRALDIIRSRDLGNSDFGRVMSAVAVVFMKTLYPDINTPLPMADAPQTHPYTRILREVERGAYTPPLSSSTDYLEHVLPFLALMGDQVRPERLNSALLDLQKASSLSSTSVLDSWFRALVYERQGKAAEAMSLYRETLQRSPDCYPASIGLSRLHFSRKEFRESLDIWQELVIRFPDNLAIKRDLARTYFELADWPRASAAIAEVLQRDPRDVSFLLMRAATLVEQGFPVQAQPSLDAIAVTQPENPRYLYLRARVQFEGYRNSEAALNYLRSLLRIRPDDLEATAYMARILLDSPRAENIAEGRRLLAILTEQGTASLLTTELALKDALYREDWRSAERLAEQVLAQRRSPDDIKSAWQVYAALKNVERATALARELLALDPLNHTYAAFWAETLIIAGRRTEALTFIDERLSTMSGGSTKSSFHFLRSTLRNDQEAALGDLRSSLFEDPRNLKALIAMFEIYHGRRDERRAVYYLKQALAVSPDNPRLRRYQTEYASSLGSN